MQRLALLDQFAHLILPDGKLCVAARQCRWLARRIEGQDFLITRLDLLHQRANPRVEQPNLLLCLFHHLGKLGRIDTGNRSRAFALRTPGAQCTRRHHRLGDETGDQRGLLKILRMPAMTALWLSQKHQSQHLPLVSEGEDGQRQGFLEAQRHIER